MANAKGKPVKIRIAGAVDENGMWRPLAGRGARDAEAIEAGRESADAPDGLSGAQQQYFITVEVRLPKLVELTGAVVETGDGIEAEEEAA